MKKIILTVVMAIISFVMNAFTGSYIYTNQNKHCDFTYFSKYTDLSKMVKPLNEGSTHLWVEFNHKANSVGDVKITFTYDNYTMTAEYKNVCVLYDIETGSFTVADIETKYGIIYYIANKNVLVVEYLRDFKQTIK